MSDATAPRAMLDDGLPDFPFFEVDAPTAAFGADEAAYLDSRTGSEVARRLTTEAKVFSSLFFVGGKLSDFGLRFKEPYRETGHNTLRALMCSFAPSHEAKEGTVALALHRWCEPIPAGASA